MLEPQGTLFFVLLMVAFAGLLVWVALAKQVVFRILAAVLAFLPAMVFGIAAVNKYYDYYQTWGAMFADVSGSSAQSIPKYTEAGVGTRGIDRQIGASTNAAEDALTGYLFQTSITGAVSHITREVYVYLPPQYFSDAYKHYKFPVIELLHGSPGTPSAWVDVMDVIPTFLDLLSSHQAQPAVLVMPDTDGGDRYALQCLNYPGLKNLQDMTYIAEDVPDYISRTLQVQAPGKAWGIAGYSEGGYCAANIGLQYPNRFGFVGSLSGYFVPSQSQIPAGGKPGGKPVLLSPYRKLRKLETLNSPQSYILNMPLGVEIPNYWLAAGSEDPGDVAAAEYFEHLLTTRLANVPVDIIQGGGHQARVWRAALTPMLEWMTPQLTTLAQEADQQAAAAAKHHPRPRTRLEPKPGTTLKPGTTPSPGTTQSPTVRLPLTVKPTL